MAKIKDGAEQPKKGRKGRKVLIVLSVILAVVLVFLGGLYAVFYHFYSKLNYDTGLSEEELQTAIDNYDPEGFLEPEDVIAAENPQSGNIQVATEDEVVSFQDEILAQIEANGGSTISDKNVWNILLIGTDSRTDSNKARSDAMILVSVNKSTMQITMTSFMRDTYVYIPDLGWYNRLNVPCTVGGPMMLVNTIEQNFGIEIDNYAMVNFYSFIDVIDAVGGVDVEILAEEIPYLNSNLNEQNKLLGQDRKKDCLEDSDAGMLHLNGNQALAYARIRKLDGDSARTARQRAVLTALMQKAMTLSLTELYDLVNTVLPMVSTDMTQNDCLSIIVNAAAYLSYDIQSLSLPAEGTYFLALVENMSVVKADLEECKRILHETIYGITE